MERLKGLFGKKDFHVVLFHVCLVLFGWPIVSFDSISRLKSIFIYLFLLWAAVIFLLFLVSRSVDIVERPEETGKGGASR